MIVDQLSSVTTGGAAVAARRLHDALLAAGVDSRFWHSSWSRTVEGDRSYRRLDWEARRRPLLHRPFAWFVAKARRRRLRKDRRELAGRSPDLEIFSVARLRRPTPWDPKVLSGDILHLHWVADNFLDHPSFFGPIPQDAPIVWTLHDMNPFTGGCHYSGGCKAFTTLCQHCPQLPRPGARDLSHRSFQCKKDSLAGKNLHIVTPNRWLESEARSSRIFANARSIQTIHYGLDVDLYAPMDKRCAKRRLGLPTEHLVVGFGAESLKNRRKGFRELLAALGRLRTSAPVVGLVFGRGVVPDASGRLPAMRSVGYLDSPSELAVVYSAADMFVLSSLEDNSPQTGLEAMACGTPVVAFETGGVPEFVRPHETGMLARVGDAADLAVQINWLANRPREMRRMSRNARIFILRRYHRDRQAHEYVELYRSLSARRRTQGRAA